MHSPGLTGRFSFWRASAFLLYSRSLSSLIRLSISVTSMFLLFNSSFCCWSLLFCSWFSLLRIWWGRKKKKKVQKKINIITDRNYSNTNIHRLIIKIYDYGWFHVSKTTNVKFNNFELIIQNIVLFFVFNFIHYYTFIKIIHFVCYLNDYCYKLTFT